MSTSNLEIKIKALVEGLDNVAKLQSTLASLGAQSVKLDSGTQGAKDAIDSLVATLTRAASTAGQLDDGLNGTGAQIEDLGERAVASSTNVDKFTQSVSKVSSQLSAVQGAAGSISSGLQLIASGAGDATGALEDAASTTNGVVQSFGDLGEMTTGVAGMLGDFNHAADDTAGKIGDTAGSMDDLIQKFLDFVGATDGASAGTGRTGDSFSNFDDVIRKMTDSMGEGADSSTSFSETLAKLANPATRASAVIGLVKDAAVSLIAPLLAIAGIKISFDYLKEAANYAASVDTLGVTLGVVSANAGYTQEEIAELEVQLKKTGISTEAARDSMIQMMQAGLSLQGQLEATTPQIVAMARAAQDLAVVTGENSSATLQRLIINIQQMDTMGLRFMGLSVDITAAQEKLALSIGTTAGALTEAQKRQAVLNEAMAQAAKLTGSYEASMESVGKKVSSLKRYSDELSNTLGTKLLPAYGALVDEATNVLKNLNAQAEAFDKSGAAAAAYGAGTAAIMEPLGRILEDVYAVILEIGEAGAPAFQMIGEAIGEVFSLAEELVGGFVELTSAGQVLYGALALVEGAAAMLATGIQGFRFILNELVSELAPFAAGLIDLQIAMISIIPGTDGAIAKLEEMKAGILELGETSGATADSIADDFLNGNTAVARFSASFYDLGTAIEKVPTTPLEDLKQKTLELVAAQRDQSMSSVEVASGYNTLKTSMEEALKTNQITQKEFDRLTATLATVGAKLKEDLDGAFKQIGMSSQELATQVSKDSAVVVGALTNIAQNGLATSDQFYDAFSTKLSMAKNIQELNAFTDALVVAGKRWPEAPRAFSDAQGQVILQFDKLLEAQLASLSTVAGWETLKNAIVGLGAAGVLSGTQVEEALKKGERRVRILTPLFRQLTKATEEVSGALEAVTEEIDKLDGAISDVADSAEGKFENMSAGYQSLADIIDQGTQQQIDAIERRFARESALVDQSYAGTEAAERRKVELGLQMEDEKLRAIESGFAKRQAYIDQSVEAERAATGVRIAALDVEIAKVSEAMGSNMAAREDYERKLSELETQRTTILADSEASITKMQQENLQKRIDAYTAYLNRLKEEDQKRVQQAADVQKEINGLSEETSAAMAEINKKSLSAHEQYEASKVQVTELMTAARKAALKGEYDESRDLYAKANQLIVENSNEVVENGKVYVSKSVAATEAERKLIELEENRRASLKLEQEAIRQAQAADQQRQEEAAKSREKALQDQQALAEQAKEGAEMKITANSDAVTKTMEDLDTLIESRARLVPIQLDLETAKATFETWVTQIGQGDNAKVMLNADVTAAEEALKTLKAHAQETTNVPLEVLTDEAMNSIGGVRDEILSLNEVKTHSFHELTVEGVEQLDGLKELMDRGNQTTTTTFDVVSNADEVLQQITEFEGHDGEVTTSTHNVVTDAATVKPVIDAAMVATQVTSTHTISTNAKDLQEPLKLATTGKQVESVHTLTTNADEVKPKIDEVMTPRPEVRSVHTIVDNAAEARAEIQSLASIVTRSTHTIVTNAQQALAEIMSLNGRNTTSVHTIQVVKTEQFATGGEVGGHGGSGGRFPYLSSGIVGGVGNTDSQPHSLDAGAFVLRKSAVQKYGAGNLLSLLEKAKSLPKLAMSSMGRVQALTMPGEIVVSKDTASRLGRRFLTALNGGMLDGLSGMGPLRFASGGSVGLVPDSISDSLRGGFSLPEAKGVAGAQSGDVLKVDLRSNNKQASVMVGSSDKDDFLDLLLDLRDRS